MKSKKEFLNDAELAEVGFKAYAAAVGGRTHDDNDIPPYSEVGFRIKGGWMACIQAVRNQFYRQIGEYIEVVFRCDLGDGNDPLEASAVIHREGLYADRFSVWVNSTMGSHERWLQPEDVISCVYAPERIEIWVSRDGFTDDDIRRTFEAIENNEQP